MAQNLITIEVVRQKLGKKGEKLTDQQLTDLLRMLRIICNKAIDEAISNKAI